MTTLRTLRWLAGVTALAGFIVLMLFSAYAPRPVTHDATPTPDAVLKQADQAGRQLEATERHDCALRGGTWQPYDDQDDGLGQCAVIVGER